MTPALHRRRFLHTGVALGASLCMPAAHACEFFSSTLRITHPWTRASAAGAQTALVCMKLDQVIRADRLVGAETPVAAGVELAGADAVGALTGAGALDLAIPAGQETLLSETGTHLRLLGLQFALEAGREYPLRLSFEWGGTVQATLSVEYARFK